MGALGNANSRRFATKGAHHRQPQRHFSSPSNHVSGIRMYGRDSLSTRRAWTAPTTGSASASGRFAMSQEAAPAHNRLSAHANCATPISALVGDFSCTRGWRIGGIGGVGGVGGVGHIGGIGGIGGIRHISACSGIHGRRDLRLCCGFRRPIVDDRRGGRGV